MNEHTEQTCPCGKTFVMRPHERTRTPNPITTYEVANGNIAVNHDGSYRVIGKSEEYGGERTTSHFVDCPLAGRFGKRARS